MNNEIEGKVKTAVRQDAESDRAIAEFLAKGGVIQHIELGKSGYRPGEEINVWGRKVTPTATVIDQDTETG